MVTPDAAHQVSAKRFNWGVNHSADGTNVTVFVSPWQGLLPRWRFVLPAEYDGVLSWGVSTEDAGPHPEPIEEPRGKIESKGTVTMVNGPTVVWFGGLEPLSTRKRAVLKIQAPLPHYIMFGQAPEPTAPPQKLEGITFAAHDHHHHDQEGGSRPAG